MTGQNIDNSDDGRSMVSVLSSFMGSFYTHCYQFLLCFNYQKDLVTILLQNQKWLILKGVYLSNLQWNKLANRHHHRPLKRWFLTHRDKKPLRLEICTMKYKGGGLSQVSPPPSSILWAPQKRGKGQILPNYPDLHQNPWVSNDLQH